VTTGGWSIRPKVFVRLDWSQEKVGDGRGESMSKNWGKKEPKREGVTQNLEKKKVLACERNKCIGGGCQSHTIGVPRFEKKKKKNILFPFIGGGMQRFGLSGARGCRTIVSLGKGRGGRGGGHCWGVVT